MRAQSFSLLCCLAAVLAVLASPTFVAAQLGDVPVVQPIAPTSPPAVSVPVTSDSDVYRVRLAVDGLVPGSVKAPNGRGITVPTRATISVFQKGLLLSTTRSNDLGRFQIPGLRPGTFSVIVDAGKYMGVFAVEVLPTNVTSLISPVAFAADEEDAETSLDLEVTSEGEGEPPVEYVMETAPAVYGGGGGGGGGGGALAGLLGLAGLAGLGGLGGGGSASPAAP